MLKALINATIFTGNETLAGKTILINNDRIESIIDPGSIPKNYEVIDCGGNYIAPGLLDLQIAGSGGFLFSAEPTAKALQAITESIIKTGTTGFLIAIPTNSPDVYRNIIKTVKANPHPAVLGLHLEGPYISPARKGAHMKDYLKHPIKDELEALIKGAEGAVRMMTVAPEICSGEIVRLLNDHGVVVAAGHSNATFREAAEGFKWGIKTTTHLFNAMSQLHHRDPGLPGATFETENIFASIIADGIHVDYNTVSIAKKIMKDRLYLISDAVEENLHGSYQHVKKHDRFTLPDGTLSGSKLTMLKAVRNCVEHVDIPLDEALRMASAYPARLINESDRGKIAPGYRADLVVFNRDFEVKQVCLDGVFNF
ncbi:MAG TPA: N-acetylglucosamine-6-phosphate deacetylase [Bacteroidales bacterium]|nr:N-acetylglucosamine-6-phosphate deacetylase [Bacteroidales bacterium]